MSEHTKGRPGEFQVGRLALRVEGDNWNAYYAKPNTMEGAVFLGSIGMPFIVANPERKQAFMDMMRDIVADHIQEATGIRPTWGDPKTAPEHERSGTA